jgi:uncharacterized membrane-anchored protein
MFWKRSSMISSQQDWLEKGAITLANAALLAGLCAYFARQNLVWSAIALVFVPEYAFGNLVVYLFQVFVVSGLLQLYRDPQTEALAETLLVMVIHEWTGSRQLLSMPFLMLSWGFPRSYWGQS